MAASDDAVWAARMRALTAFAPGYFHDLKGPLNTIVLRLELLRVVPAGDGADEKRRASVAAIEEQVRRLDRLLQGWLQQTAPDSTGDGCDVRALLQDLAALAAPAARKARVELTLSVPAEAVQVRAPQLGLTAALLDLLRQAICGSGSGHVIALELVSHGGRAHVVLRGAALDAAATALAAGIVGAAGGACSVQREPDGAAVMLTLPLG
jgi:C4-dicarboxylate-specific signal transduction histidine kinase